MKEAKRILREHKKLNQPTYWERLKADPVRYEKHKAYMRECQRNNKKYSLARNLRMRVYAAIKHGYKSAPTMELLGCTLDELKVHLASQFTEGMSWNNYGLWHIDHIRPCASFDLTQPDQQRVCFHYTNLQPLWAKDNSIKGSLWNGTYIRN